MVKTSSSLNWFVLEVIIFSDKKDWVLKAGSYNQSRKHYSTLLCPGQLVVLAEPCSFSGDWGAGELCWECEGHDKAWGVSSFHGSSLLNLRLCTCYSPARHIGTWTCFCCPNQGATIRLTGAQRLAVRKNHTSPKEDRKPCPTRSNLVRAHFQNKSSQKSFAEPPSPTQHHEAGRGTPAAHAHTALGGGETTQQSLCWMASYWGMSGLVKVLFKTHNLKYFWLRKKAMRHQRNKQ